MMLGELNPIGGGDTIALNEERLVVGRRSKCDLTLRFNDVSNQHCELEFRSGYWFARDLTSSNGTKVNGIELDIEPKCVLPGDEIMFATHAYHIDYAVAEDAELPEEDNPLEMSLMEKAGLQSRRRESNGAAPSRKSNARSKRRASPKDEFLMEWFSEE